MFFKVVMQYIWGPGDENKNLKQRLPIFAMLLFNHGFSAVNTVKNGIKLVALETSRMYLMTFSMQQFTLPSKNTHHQKSMWTVIRINLISEVVQVTKQPATLACFSLRTVILSYCFNHAKFLRGRGERKLLSPPHTFSSLLPDKNNVETTYWT